MKEHIAKRAMLCAQFMLENQATVRGCAKQFGVSKTTVHKDLKLRLPMVSAVLAKQVNRLLDVNRCQRHIRGGQSTKQKYLLMQSRRERLP